MDQSIKARLADPSTGKKRKEFLDRFVKGEFSSLKAELAQHKEETKSFLSELESIENEVQSHGNLHIAQIDVICKLIVLLADFQKKIADSRKWFIAYEDKID